MSSLADTFFTRALGLLESVRQKNADTLARLAPVIGQSIAQGGVVHTFGSGHSDVIAREIIGRAGGLVCVNGIIDPTGGFIENLVGYGTTLAERYDHVGWFITESRADIAGVQKLDTPVTSVLLETKFSGERAVADDTPIWKLDVK